MVKTPCLSADQFRTLFLGQVSDEQLLVLEQHLRECGKCSSTIEHLKVDDTLLSNLRAGGAVAGRAEQAVQGELLARVQALVAAQAPNAETAPPRAAPDLTSDTLAPASPADPNHDFLAPAQAPDELGRLGPYRVRKVLGAGGMGMVFLAEDARLGRPVALKAMLPALAARPDARERFLREARAAAAIEHDHIVAIYQVDEDRGVPYIAMPLLKGMSLEDWLSRRESEKPGPRPVAQILKIGRQIASGLAAAHAAGLIHRDIKPANVWLDSSAGGRVKILDFGLARATTGEQNLTQPGMIMGTPSYMAPEQARGEKADSRSDLFSLGVVLYRLCTGVLPFRGRDTMSTLVAVALDNPPPPCQDHPEVPAGLSDLVMKLLAKDPAQRIQTAPEVVKAIQALEKAAAGQDRTEMVSTPAVPAAKASGSLPPGLGETGPHRPRRRGLVIAAACGFVALVVAAAVFFWQTANGVVRIEVNDPDIQVVFDKDGPTIKGADKHDVSLRAGDHTLHVKRGDLELDTDRFLLRKGETVVLKIELLRGKVQVVQGDRVIGEKELPPDPVAVAPAGPPFTNSIGMKFARLPAGKFLMGSPATQAGRNENEEQHEVVLTRPFFLGVHEVTVGQFKAFVKATDYKTQAEKTGEGAGRHFTDGFKMDVHTNWRNPGFAQTDDHPVVCVSWNDAVAFCNWLSDKEGKQYHLPTEAQWEFACRAGSTGRYGFGDAEAELDQYAWTGTNADGKTHPVGQLKPNAWGLYDMHGNAWEWTADWYAADYYRKAVKEDPPGPASGSVGVLRGGNWASKDKVFVTAAHRQRTHRDYRNSGIGFRVACVVSQLPTGPSPFDRLRREDIPAGLLAKAGNGDKEKAPKEIVAILGPGIYSEKLSPDGKTLALAYQLGKPPGPVTNKLTLWDVATGAESLLAPVTATGMVFSHDSKLLALSHSMFHSNNIGGTVWDLARRKEMQVLSRAPNRQVCFAFTPDDRSIFFCSPHNGGDRLSQAAVQGRNPGAAPPRVSFEQGDVGPHILRLSPDGSVLAAGVGNRLKMWYARTGKLLLDTVTPAQRSIHDMAFSPDSKLLASAEDYNANVEVLEVTTRKRLGTFDQGKGTTVSVTFHSDGALAASCGHDGVVRLWNPRTFTQKRVLHLNPPTGGQGHDFWDLQFAPDGRHLLAKNPGGLVYVLRLAPPPAAPPQGR